jgi:hypothetical protein
MATLTLRPNAPGDVTGLARLGGTANWQCVDDVTPDEDASYVAGPGSPNYDLYRLPAHTVESGVINSIKVYARVKENESGGATGGIETKTGTHEYAWLINDFPTSYTTYSYTWTANPETGLPWTWANVDSYQIGVAINKAGKGSGGKCTQVYCEVDYTPGKAAKGGVSGRLLGERCV